MDSPVKVFISATTSDLGSWRLKVRDLLLSVGLYPILQDHIVPDYRTVSEMLHTKIAECSAVIHLVGRCYGAEPKLFPPGTARRSYTQIEAEIARTSGKKLFVFLLDEHFPYDSSPSEPQELRDLQKQYRASITESDFIYIPCSTPEYLLTQIAGLIQHVHTPPKKSKIRYVLVFLLLLFLFAGLSIGSWTWYSQYSKSRQSATAALTAVTAVMNRGVEAHADPLARELRQQAKETQRQGHDLFEKGRFLDAKSAWEESHRLFGLALNRAEQVGAYQNAKQSFEAALFAADRTALAAYGGAKWEEVQGHVKRAEESVSDPTEGRTYYELAERLLAVADKEAREAAERARAASEAAMGTPAVEPAAAVQTEVSQTTVERKEDFTVRVGTADHRLFYREGEKIIFHLEASKDCYVTFYTIGPDDQLTLLLPNRRQPRPFLQKGEVVAFPDRNAGYEFTISPPFGKTIVKAIATSQPLRVEDAAELMSSAKIDNILAKYPELMEWTSDELFITTASQSANDTD